ncbi:methyltransferase [Methylomonas sp. AM2-LC]|uniref:methyltransferase n=1 Tax=Methylomonas sp. AM2-LC TaxID=3153301 RepID=UPI0032646FDF
MLKYKIALTGDYMDILAREDELASYLDRQPYVIEQDGIALNIDKNVFPSDFGITSSFFGHYILQQKATNSALDMGCGSGYFAFLLKKIGCTSVVGVDFNQDAINCAIANAALNPALQPITFIHSDLFKSVPLNRFGIIVFNFNYYPSNGVFGLNADGGREILERFFSQVIDYIDSNSRIYSNYSA